MGNKLSSMATAGIAGSVAKVATGASYAADEHGGGVQVGDVVKGVQGLLGAAKSPAVNSGLEKMPHEMKNAPATTANMLAGTQYETNYLKNTVSDDLRDKAAQWMPGVARDAFGGALAAAANAVHMARGKGTNFKE